MNLLFTVFDAQIALRRNEWWPDGNNQPQPKLCSNDAPEIIGEVSAGVCDIKQAKATRVKRTASDRENSITHDDWYNSTRYTD